MPKLSPGVQTYTHNGVDMLYTVRGGRAELNRIRTPTELRGQGRASAAMKQWLDAADAAQMQTALTPDPMDKTTSKAKLKRWYSGLGYVPNRGRNKDFSTTAAMIRPARIKKSAVRDAVIKARRSLNAPKTKAQAQRRAALYQRLANAAGDSPRGKIAALEASRLQGVIQGGKFGRGKTDGRDDLERVRTQERKRTDRNNDGWIDGQKPKGAKPRKTATKKPTKTDAALDRLRQAQAQLASIKDNKFSVTQSASRIEVGFAYNRADVDAIKAIPGAKYDPNTKRWSVSTRQAEKLAEMLEQRGRIVAAERVAPKPPAMRTVTGNTYDIRDKLKAMGGKWDAANRVWMVPGDKWEEAQALAKPKPRAAPTKPTYQREEPKRSWSEREMFPVDRLPAAGSTYRDGDRIMYVEGHGKAFRISDDASSMGNRHVIGREGDRGAYAYLKPATPEQAAAHIKRERRAKRQDTVSAGKKTILRNVERLAAQYGDRPPLDRLPEGDWLSPIDASKSLYGYGEGLLLDKDGKTLWHVRRNGADGDNWANNNAPGSIVTRLALPEDRLQRVRRAFRVRKAVCKALRTHGPYTIKTKGKRAEAHLDGKRVGWAEVRPRLFRPMSLEGVAVDADHRRKGLATAMSNALESKHRRKIKDALPLTREGKAFWANRTVRKDMSPILKAAVAKARRSLPDPKTRAQAERRAALYERFASAPGKRSAGGKARIAIAQAEAQYLRTKSRVEDIIAAGKDGGQGGLRGLQWEASARRRKLEEQRARAATSAARRKQDKNNDGYQDGLKPKGAKPRKTADQAPARAAVQGATAQEVAARIAPKKSASASADANIVSRYVTLLGNAKTASAGNAIVDQLAEAKGIRVVELIALMQALTGAGVKRPKPTLLADLRAYVRNSRHDKGYTPGVIK